MGRKPGFKLLPWLRGALACEIYLGSKRSVNISTHGKISKREPWQKYFAMAKFQKSAEGRKLLHLREVQKFHHGKIFLPWQTFRLRALGRNVRLNFSTHGKICEAEPWQNKFAMANLQKFEEGRKLLHPREVEKFHQAQKLALGSNV